MGSLSAAEQRKLAYFHALGKVMTENTQAVYESPYKSSHNVRLNEVWSTDIAFADTYVDAVAESVTNSAVTLIEKQPMTPIFGSNGQAYNYFSGATFIRPWISPVDIPQVGTNLPSNGYQVRLFKGDDTEIFITQGAWSVDYYAGIIHFAENYTPSDMGWGAIKVTFFQYTGDFGASGGTSDPSVFKTAHFDSGTSELVFNSGTSYEYHVDLSYLDNIEAFTGATFDSGTSIITLTDGQGNTTEVDLSTLSGAGFTTAKFDSGTTSMIFNEGEPTETTVDLSYLDNIDAFTGATFDSGTSTITFTDGEGSTTTVDLSSLKNVSGTTSAMSPSNTNMNALTTTSGSTLACSTALLAGNVPNSMVAVFVNGVQYNVGNSSSDDCYFSNDGGTTKRTSGDEDAGDLLYWNYNGGSTPQSGYELDASVPDKITFIHLTV